MISERWRSVGGEYVAVTGRLAANTGNDTKTVSRKGGRTCDLGCSKTGQDDGTSIEWGHGKLPHYRTQGSIKEGGKRIGEEKSRKSGRFELPSLFLAKRSEHNEKRS